MVKILVPLQQVKLFNYLLINFWCLQKCFFQIQTNVGNNTGIGENFLMLSNNADSY